jgi:hypothetical protein
MASKYQRVFVVGLLLGRDRLGAAEQFADAIVNLGELAGDETAGGRRVLTRERVYCSP